ncbi:MAG: hypothetical protein ACRD1U_16955 [Vicinamibacterales bacterium]
MNRKVAIGLLVCSLMAVPATSSADSTTVIPGCGTVTNRNSSHQYGAFNWLEYVVETTGSVDICGQFIVAVEAHVVGVPNSSLWRQGVMYVTARRAIMVPKYGRWQTSGEHFVSGTIPNIFCCGGWWPAGKTTSIVDVVPPGSSDPASQCNALGSDYYWNGWECVYTPGSPIIVDGGRNGYQLTSVEDGVRFDLDTDGAPEQVAWTREGSDDSFLAMDRNGNGRIDNGAELFGNYTPAHASGGELTTANGFEALAFLHSPGYGESLPDDQIDAQDAAFARLLLWRDENHNGISEPNELRTAASAGVVAISTDYKNRKRVDRFGNEFRQQGQITWANGRDPVYDVWLKMHP